MAAYIEQTVLLYYGIMGIKNGGWRETGLRMRTVKLKELGAIQKYKAFHGTLHDKILFRNKLLLIHRDEGTKEWWKDGRRVKVTYET